MQSRAERTPPTTTARRRGVIAAGNLIPAIAPLGVALGVSLGAMSVPAAVSWLSAPLMVAGASQLVLFSQLESGAGLVAASAAAVLLNSRFVVYGAALAQRFAHGQPMWFRLLGPHYIVDQTYAMTLTGIADHDGSDDFRHYFAAAGTILWVVWSASVGAGILLGPALPEELPLEFVLPASFVALIVPSLTRRTEAAAAVAGAAIALLGIGPTVSLTSAAVLGGLIGGATTRSGS